MCGNEGIAEEEGWQEGALEASTTRQETEMFINVLKVEDVQKSSLICIYNVLQVAFSKSRS